MYILNDFADREANRKHPKKCFRPIASGALNPYVSLVFEAVLLSAALVLAWFLNKGFGLLLLFYFIINVLYSLYIKHVVIADIMIIAIGFVLRAIGGALIMGVVFTLWFLFCIMFLALFLAIGKRRHEMYLLNTGRSVHRRVLNYYTPVFLNQLNSIVTTGVLMSYLLFTFTSGHTIQLSVDNSAGYLRLILLYAFDIQ